MSKYWIAATLYFLVGCNQKQKSLTYEEIPDANDVHSYAQPEIAKITHLDLDLSVDFSTRTISGTASYDIQTAPDAEEIVLDVNNLNIDSVWIDEPNGNRIPTAFQIGSTKDYMGAPLTIDITASTSRVTILYRTNPEAAALQWLDPVQTLGKTDPFLFTQGQAILTRTWIPIQDSPGIRYTYTASVEVPSGLLALMSASNPMEKSEDGIYSFEMQQPIPAYLMALAVGNIEFQSISDRTGVYAEPGMLADAAYEMADLEKMVVATESLYGPYLWDRYDIIVLPPSFPFGGMENPRLTFATPTIIAGDRSLTALVAHELAHSWSGNLVTNATWDDFWLNEGHTVYIERRIMEALYGRSYSEMLAKLGLQDLTSTIDDMGPTSEDSHLKLSLDGRDPDDGMNDVAYEKGYLLLRTLEERVGRETFDAYLKAYFEAYKFKSLSTEQWESYVRQHLIDPNDLDIDLTAWLYGPGIPADHAQPVSNKFDQVDRHASEFVRLGRLDRSSTRDWSTHEWLHFIRQIPADLHMSFYEKLDDVYALSDSGNSEILAAWLEKSIQSGYLRDHNLTQLKDFLMEVGRRKFLSPLYRALKENGELALAREIFEKARPNYHSVSSNSISALLSESEEM